MSSLAFAKPESTPRIDIGASLAPLSKPVSSPIDRYYKRAGALVVRAQRAEDEGEQELIPLLFLRLISATEAYFREVLVRAPGVCPLVRATAGSVSVPLGAVMYYNSDQLALAAIEHCSLCTEGELAKQAKKLTGFICEKDASLREAIKLFEKVSQLRHAVVHAYDEVYFLNVGKLELATPERAQVVSISPFRFQEFVGVCHSVVRAFNRAFSEWILSEWRARDMLAMGWQKNRFRFTKFVSLFRSAMDATETRTPKEIFVSISMSVESGTFTASAT